MSLVGVHAADKETGEWELIAVGQLLAWSSSIGSGLIDDSYEVRVDHHLPANEGVEKELLDIYRNRDPLRIRVFGSAWDVGGYYEVLCRCIDRGRYLDLDLTVQKQLELVSTT